MSASTAENELAQLLAPAFGRAAFRVHRNKPLIFICGGNNRGHRLALRHQFLGHIVVPSLRILPVLAESAFPHQLIEGNLLNFEAFLADTADCVLIFVESPGSIAETGLFAGRSRIAKKTLVVNMRSKSTNDSFLNLGPIKLIRRQSQFDTVFYLDKRKVTLWTCPHF